VNLVQLATQARGSRATLGRPSERNRRSKRPRFLGPWRHQVRQHIHHGRSTV